MGFNTRWDFILDKARKESKKEEEDLLLAWADRIARAHKKFRVDLGPEETQRLAELDWWKHLFLEEKFPESPQEWQQDAHSNLSKDASSTKSTTLQSSPSQIAITHGVRAAYTSCWETIKLKALDAGIPLGEIMDDYRASVAQALKGYLRDYGQAVAIFRAELHLWRDLFPEEYFPGINPVTGERNRTTGADLFLCRSPTEDHLDSTSQHPDASTNTEQAKSSADDWQQSEPIGVQQEISDVGTSQDQEVPRTEIIHDEESYRTERRIRGHSRSRSRSPEASAHRPDARQRSPLREPFNKSIPIVPHTHQATTNGSPFPFRGSALIGRGSPQMMRGTFQNNRGAFKIRGASQTMRDGPQNNRGLNFRGGRGAVPWGPGGFQNNRGAAHSFRGAMQNPRGNPQNFRGSFQKDRSNF